MAEGNTKSVRWPCGVCGRGIGNNSIQCISCQKWKKLSMGFEKSDKMGNEWMGVKEWLV